MFMFWGSERYPYVQGAKLPDGEKPSPWGCYKVPNVDYYSRVVPMYTCDDKLGEMLTEIIRVLIVRHDEAVKNLDQNKKDWLQALPPELRT